MGGSTGTGGDMGTGGSGPIEPPPPPTEDLPPCKRTVPVANSGALGPAIDGAMPGDCLVLADGNYTLPSITKKATAAAPIVIKAANTLKAVVASGGFSIADSAYVVVQGLMYTGNEKVWPFREQARPARVRLGRPGDRRRRARAPAARGSPR